MAQLVQLSLEQGIQNIELDDNFDYRNLTSAVENHTKELKRKHETELRNTQEGYEKETADMVKEVETLKSHVVSRILILRKAAHQGDQPFDEKAERDYFMGLNAARLITEAAHFEGANTYTPSLVPNATTVPFQFAQQPNGGAGGNLYPGFQPQGGGTKVTVQ